MILRAENPVGVRNPLVADLDFARFKAIGMACDNGSTLPATPAVGQWFLHTPVGRNMLYMYDGSDWMPIISLGSMTVYVDNTDGTDSLDKGYGADSDAFKTIQFAVDAVPGLFSGNVTIKINDETYNESVVIRGKRPTGDYVIWLTGTLSTTDTGTCIAGSVKGTGATQGTVVDDTGGWTVNAYQNKLAYFNAGVNSGSYRVIDSNTADTLIIVGTWPNGAPAAGDTFTIYDWGTVINGAEAIDIRDGQKAVSIQKLKLNPSSGTLAAYVYNFASASFYLCSIESLSVYLSAAVQFTSCFISSATNNNLWVDTQSFARLYSSKVLDAGGANTGISIIGSIAVIRDGTIVDGFTTNLVAQQLGAVRFYSPASTGYVRIRNATIGVLAKINGNATNTASVQYSGNTTDENAQAASYGYID